MQVSGGASQEEETANAKARGGKVPGSFSDQQEGQRGRRGVSRSRRGGQRQPGAQADHVGRAPVFTQ